MPGVEEIPSVIADKQGTPTVCKTMISAAVVVHVPFIVSLTARAEDQISLSKVMNCDLENKLQNLGG